MKGWSRRGGGSVGGKSNAAAGGRALQSPRWSGAWTTRPAPEAPSLHRFSTPFLPHLPLAELRQAAHQQHVLRKVHLSKEEAQREEGRVGGGWLAAAGGGWRRRLSGAPSWT